MLATNLVMVCADPAGTVICPILLPLHALLPQGPSSQMFILNALFVLGARNKLILVLFPGLVPSKAFNPFLF